MYSYKLTLAYLGAPYHGFQVQKNHRTVQGVLMEAAGKIFEKDFTITGASRTDAGVHANGQVVVLKAQKKLECRSLILALNSNLPEDVSIFECEMVDDDWHPRYQKVLKTYRYDIYNNIAMHPRYVGFAYHIKYKLDMEMMRKCARHLVGKHDFFSYSNVSEINDSVRTIESIDILERGSLISIIVKGDGFLYNMVRIIAGTLIECASGKRSEEDIKKSLKESDRSLSGMTAPARGLTLEKIEYLAEK